MKKPIELMLDKVEWTELRHDGKPPAGLYATHEGILQIEKIKLKVYQLNDGRRVIDHNDLAAIFYEI